METIRISEYRLRVMLTEADMTKYKISREFSRDLSREASHSLRDARDPSFRTAIKNILRDAERTGGFDPDKSQLYIQLYPDKHGGCELFVTRTENKPAKKPEAPPCREVFSFDSLEDLISFASRAVKSFSGHSEAFAEIDGSAYYISLSGTETAEGGRLTPEDIADEYGGVRSGYGIDVYIAEHCRPITPAGRGDVLAALAALK